MPFSDVNALYDKIMSLNELIWEGRADRPAVEQWLENFTGDCTNRSTERRHALYLLSKFLYYGHAEVRHLLRSMYQDLIRNPLTVEVRARASDKDDFGSIHQGFLDEVGRTRFLGLGKPAESGTRLLYDFRLINDLSVNSCLSVPELFTGAFDNPHSEWAFPEVERVVFIDDFCGTGDQAAGIGHTHLPWMRKAAKHKGVVIDVWYLTLLATTTGLANLRSQALFDRVQSVSELDKSYRAFDVTSQFYANAPDGLDKDEAESIAKHYGELLCPGQPLGYRDSQLLLGFQHNVPDNTLPIMSRERVSPPWHPIFPRIEKLQS